MTRRESGASTPAPSTFRPFGVAATPPTRLTPRENRELAWRMHNALRDGRATGSSGEKHRIDAAPSADAVAARLASLAGHSHTLLRTLDVVSAVGPALRFDVALGEGIVLPIEHVLPPGTDEADRPDDAAGLVERAVLANRPRLNEMAATRTAILREAEALATMARAHGIAVGDVAVGIAPRGSWTALEANQYTVALGGVDHRLEPANITQDVAEPSQVAGRFMRELGLLRRRLGAREQVASLGAKAWADQLTLRALEWLDPGRRTILPRSGEFAIVDPDTLLFWHQGVLRSLRGDPSSLNWIANTVMAPSRGLPETLLVALTGRPATDAFGHHLLDGGMVIAAARNTGASADARLELDLDIPLVPITADGVRVAGGRDV